MRLAAGLSRGGYLGSLPSLFNTEEERFQQRFAALSVLFRPEPLTYDQYRTSMDMTGPLHPSFVYRCPCIQDSRSTLAFPALKLQSSRSCQFYI